MAYTVGLNMVFPRVYPKMENVFKEFDLDTCMDKMKRLNFGLDEDSNASNQKQTNQQEAKTESQKEVIQYCIKYLVSCQCRKSKCRSPSCRILRGVLKHLKNCNKMNGECSSCRHFISFCCYYSKSCKEDKCLIPSCRKERKKVRVQMFQLLRQARKLRRSEATMQNIGMFNAVPQSSPGNYSSSQRYPGARSYSPLHPSQPGKKLSTEPPVGALQAVQQVQVAAARETTPHMIAASVSYGKENPCLPSANIGVMATSHQMQTHIPILQMSGVPNYMLNNGNFGSWEGSGFTQNSQPYQNLHPQPTPQMGIRQQTQIMRPGSMPNSIENSAMGYCNQIMLNPGPSLGEMQRPTPAWQQLIETSAFKLCSTTKKRLAYLKINPHLKAGYMKQRTAQQQPAQQMVINESSMIATPPSN